MTGLSPGRDVRASVLKVSFIPLAFPACHFEIFGDLREACSTSKLSVVFLVWYTPSYGNLDRCYVMGRLTGAPVDLATWTSPSRTCRRIPATRAAWGIFGLFFQLRCSVRLDNERNFGLTLTTLEVNDGKHIVDQLLNRVVAPELMREVSTHAGPFCKWQGANSDDTLQEYVLNLRITRACRTKAFGLRRLSTGRSSVNASSLFEMEWWRGLSHGSSLDWGGAPCADQASFYIPVCCCHSLCWVCKILRGCKEAAHVHGLLESLPGATARGEGAFEGGLLRGAHVPIALRRENGQRKPLKSVENVVRGDVLQVLGYMDSVEEACRTRVLRGDARPRNRVCFGRTGTAPRGEVPRRNVEDSHSALQEMQARLAAETDEQDHLSRAGDELDKRIVLQKLLSESPATVGLALSSCEDAR